MSGEVYTSGGRSIPMYLNNNAQYQAQTGSAITKAAYMKKLALTSGRVPKSSDLANAKTRVYDS